MLTVSANDHQRRKQRQLRWLKRWLGGSLQRLGRQRSRFLYTLAAKPALAWLWGQVAELAMAPWQRRRLGPLAAVLGRPLPPLRRRNPSHRRWQPPPPTALCRSVVLGYGDFWLALPRRRRWSLRRWWSWLAGVVDGDGHLSVPQSKWGVVLNVAGNTPEVALLGRVRRLLGGGTISRPDPKGGLGRSYSLSHPRRLRRFLAHCAPLLRNPLRQRQALAAARRLKVPLSFSAEPPNDDWRMGFLETDGSVSSGGPSHTLAISCTNAELQPLRHFGETFRHRWETLQPRQPHHQVLHRCFLAISTDRQLRRVLRRLAVTPYAGPKGPKLRLLPRYRGLRRAKAHLASPVPGATAAWAAFRRRWRALRGVSKRRPGDPPLDPRFCRLPPFRSGGPRPSAADRRRLALLLAGGGRLGLRRRGRRHHLRLDLTAESRDRPLLERLRRWLERGSWRRSRRPSLQLAGAASIHRLALLVAPHWRRAHRRWIAAGRPTPLQRRRPPTRWTVAELRRQLPLQLAPLLRRRRRRRPLGPEAALHRKGLGGPFTPKFRKIHPWPGSAAQYRIAKGFPEPQPPEGT